MIARANRFHGHNSVGRVRGTTYQGDLLSVRFQYRRSGAYRMAVVVSKKVDNRAVVRNRIRRRLFEAFGRSMWLQNTPVDLIVYAKTTNLATIPAADVESATLKALKFIESRSVI